MGTTATHTLTRRLQKILEGGPGANARSGALDDDVVKALNGMEGFFADNTHKARRNLRGDLERRGLEINDEFITAFKEVNDKLARCCEQPPPILGARWVPPRLCPAFPSLWARRRVVAHPKPHPTTTTTPARVRALARDDIDVLTPRPVPPARRWRRPTLTPW